MRLKDTTPKTPLSYALIDMSLDDMIEIKLTIIYYCRILLKNRYFNRIEIKKQIKILRIFQNIQY